MAVELVLHGHEPASRVCAARAVAAIGQARWLEGSETARLVMKTMALFILGRRGDARAAIDSVRLTGGARATTLILSKWTNDGRR